MSVGGVGFIIKIQRIKIDNLKTVKIFSVLFIVIDALIRD
jgi:hypothetical protein